MGDRLAGRSAIVTGASQGIGEGIARTLAHAGARVYVADVLEEEGRAVAAGLTEDGLSASFVLLDVTSPDAWQEALTRIEAETGRLDIVVNNAGIYRPPGVADETLDGWNRVLAVNLTGTFLGMHASIPALRRSGGGSIVNISSVCTHAAGRTGAAYHASKGGVLTLTKAAAIELAADGIRVNSVHPGSIDTPMASAARGGDSEALRWQASRHPLGRLGRPTEIGHAVLYLAGDESSFVTGHALVVDGGFSVW